MLDTTEEGVAISPTPPVPPNNSADARLIISSGFELTESYLIEITDISSREFNVLLAQEDLARLLLDLGYPPAIFIRIGCEFWAKSQVKSISILPQEAE